MNEFAKLERQAKMLKESYPKGTRILLIEMGNDPQPIEPNTRGTVECVDDIGTIHCAFDNGRHLGVVYGEDTFHKLTQEEIDEENASICVEETTEELLGEGPSM